MKIRLSLYVLLVSFVFIQIVLMKYAPWFPDIILLMVVFTGIFRGSAEGAALGLAAGFFRGCFSVGTIAPDIFLFPAVGAMSSELAGRFYRHNAAAQMLITAGSILTVVVSHTLYLNFTSGNDASVFFVILTSWKYLATTVFISPFLFAFLKKTLRLKEQIITKKYIKEKRTGMIRKK